MELVHDADTAPLLVKTCRRRWLRGGGSPWVQGFLVSYSLSYFFRGGGDFIEFRRIEYNENSTKDRFGGGSSGMTTSGMKKGNIQRKKTEHICNKVYKTNVYD